MQNQNIDFGTYLTAPFSYIFPLCFLCKILYSGNQFIDYHYAKGKKLCIIKLCLFFIATAFKMVKNEAIQTTALLIVIFLFIILEAYCYYWIVRAANGKMGKEK